MSLKKSAASFFQKIEQNILRRKNSSSASSEKFVLVPKAEVERFVSDCLRSVGVVDEDSKTVGHHLMTADYRGHFSHGLNRLEMYVRDIQTKATDPHAKPEIVQDFKVERTFLILFYLSFDSYPISYWALALFLLLQIDLTWSSFISVVHSPSDRDNSKMYHKEIDKKSFIFSWKLFTNFNIFHFYSLFLHGLSLFVSFFHIDFVDRLNDLSCLLHFKFFKFYLHLWHHFYCVDCFFFF